MAQKYFVKECFDCGGDTTVVDSRLHYSGGIYRRRKCLVCGFLFSTMEIECSMDQDYNLQEEIRQLRQENAMLKTKIEAVKQLIV